MSDPRRGKGFAHAAGLLSDRIRQAGERRGFAVPRVLTHWDEVVGPDLAALARPVRVSWGREGFGGTLTLLASGAAAPLVQMRAPEIRARVNACYGYNAISHVRLTQTAASGFAEAQASFAGPGAAPAAAPEPPAQARAAATEAVERVRDPGLRAALAALGAQVLARDRPG